MSFISSSVVGMIKPSPVEGGLGMIPGPVSHPPGSAAWMLANRQGREGVNVPTPAPLGREGMWGPGGMMHPQQRVPVPQTPPRGAALGVNAGELGMPWAERFRK